MTTITHGQAAPKLLDGSSLIQEITLTAEQSLAIVHDLAVLTADRSSRFKAKVLNVGGRAASVTLLLGLAALIITESVNLVGAGILAVLLLFSVDGLNYVDKKLAERRELKTKALKFSNVVFGMTSSRTFSKSYDEKLENYFELLRNGEAKVGNSVSHRLRLAGGNGSSQTLQHVVVAHSE